MRTAITSQLRVQSPVGNRLLLSLRVSSWQGWLVLGAVFALSCGSGIAVSQEPDKKAAGTSRRDLAAYAVIFCTVWDPDSHPVYGVHVQLRRAGEKKYRWEAYSDHRGELAFRVPPGKVDYELAADEKSLKALKSKGLINREPVKVHVEYDEQVDTGLHLTK